MKQWVVTYSMADKCGYITAKIRVIGANEDSAKFFAMQLTGCNESDIIKVRRAKYNRIS